MLLAIALQDIGDGRLRAVAPDLAHCDLTGATEQELLPKLRLAMEGELTRLLLASLPLPDARGGTPLRGFDAGTPSGGTLRWLTVHINLDHLRALARHQAGR
jgi:hypothetical protein